MTINREVYNSLPISIQNLVQAMVTRLRPKKIILFGSRARGDNRENSDFDIAVEYPIELESEFTRLAVDLIDEPITLFHVDLVDLKKLDKDYQANVAKDGQIIYG